MPIYSATIAKSAFTYIYVIDDLFLMIKCEMSYHQHKQNVFPNKSVILHRTPPPPRSKIISKGPLGICDPYTTGKSCYVKEFEQKLITVSNRWGNLPLKLCTGSLAGTRSHQARRTDRINSVCRGRGRAGALFIWVVDFNLVSDKNLA